MTKEYVAVHCNTPLIQTCRFLNTEYFCRKCRRSFGMLDVDTVKMTLKLKAELVQNNNWFISKYDDRIKE